MTISASPGPTYTRSDEAIRRYAYTPEYRATLDYFSQELAAIGFTVHEDAVGTLYARNRPPGAPSIQAGEIGWIENFALATDRGGPLEQLIPGADDYYYYHCLHLQNTEKWDSVPPLLKAWVERHNWTPR